MKQQNTIGQIWSKRIAVVIGVAFLLQAVFGVLAPAISSAVTINPDAPNCFDAVSTKPIPCNELVPLVLGHPAEPGHCYAITAALPPAVNEQACDAIIAKDNQAQVTAANANDSAALNAISNTDREKIANCPGSESAQKLQECLQTNPIVNWLQITINVLSASVGVIATIMVIVGGIQYMTAGPNPGAVTAAKTKIFNAVIAIVALVFMYSFLQWLVPGGIF